MKSKQLISGLGAAMVLGSGGASLAQQRMLEGVSVAPFGKTADGKNVELYTLQNKNGMTVKVMTYGAIVTSIVTKDRDGNPGRCRSRF